MNDYPQYVEVNKRKYKINTDFRVAIKCNEIAIDNTIGDFERVLGIICTLFGQDSINYPEDYEKLLKMAKKYLSCGKDIEDSNEQQDMDYVEDMDYIEASFMSDYNIDLSNQEMHWWKFNKLMNGLSNSELGNCCILNRIRNLRNFDTKDIKDIEEKTKIEKAKKQVSLKNKNISKTFTNEEKRNMEEFNKLMRKE